MLWTLYVGYVAVYTLTALWGLHDELGKWRRLVALGAVHAGELAGVILFATGADARVRVAWRFLFPVFVAVHLVITQIDRRAAKRQMAAEGESEATIRRLILVTDVGTVALFAPAFALNAAFAFGTDTDEALAG